jgi:ABC-type sugar transport system substrate-binding protein
MGAFGQTPAATGGKKKTAAILMPQYADYFKIVADAAAAPLKEQGYEVDILSANNDGVTMIKQIQNCTVKKVDLMYLLPAGDPGVFHDAVKEAHDAGIKVIVSHNSTGKGSADSIIQDDEFDIGVMGSAMVGEWIDANFPNAKAGSVKVLVLENSWIPDMIKRSTGMKIIAQKFLRQVDMRTASFVTTKSDKKAWYMKDGKKLAVDEPTGGLVLDGQGNAILNPFYNPKAAIVTYNNRTIMSNIDAQKAMDVVFTANGGKNKDISAIICYSGMAAVGASEKFISMKEQGLIAADLKKVAVFGADNTKENVDHILQSADTSKSVLRGVMTAGDIISTISTTIGKVAAGESVPAEQWEQIGYMVSNKDYTGTRVVTYANQLPATSLFIK